MSEIEQFQFITEIKLACGLMLMALTIFAGGLTWVVYTVMRGYYAAKRLGVSDTYWVPK